MSFIVTYWEVIAAILSIIAVTIISVIKFFKKSNAEQLANVKEWLLLAVTNAEKDFGSGTGKLKLRYVYDLFVTKFPSTAKIISFEEFSKLVDESLAEMNNLLSSNNAIQSYVGGIYVNKEE